PIVRENRWAGPLHRFGIPFVFSMRAAEVLGIARHAIDLLVQLAPTKKPFGTGEFLRDQPRTQAAVGRAEAALAGVRGLIYATTDEIWETVSNDQPATAEQMARMRLYIVYTAETCCDIVESMYR